MPITVDDLRLAWVWVESFPPSLVGPLVNQVVAAPLNVRDQFATSFAAAKVAPKGAPVTLPWHTSDSHRLDNFWRYYLANVTPSTVPAGDAWRNLVPLRRALGWKITAQPGTRVRLRSYLYPHGYALVATVAIENQLPLDQAVDTAIQVVKNPLEITWSVGPSVRLSLSALGVAALDRLRTESYGPGAVPGVQSGQPFTVAGIVRGSGADPAVPVAEGSEVHRALEGLCRWDPHWKLTAPGKLSEGLVPIKRAPPGHVLYGTSRGRAIWFPATFQSGRSRSGTLACYFNNLLCASLQTESLTGLLDLATALLPDRLPTVTPDAQRLIQSACRLVAQLYGDSPKIYRSISPRRQIDDSGMSPNINSVRNYFGLTPLATSPPGEGGVVTTGRS